MRLKIMFLTVALIIGIYFIHKSLTENTYKVLDRRPAENTDKELAKRLLKIFKEEQAGPPEDMFEKT